MNPWLSVIGIGDDGLAGLSPAARTLVETAQTLVGGARHLAMVPGGGAERLPWRQPLGDTIADIAARRGTRVAVLASGDPLWYGVGTVLLRHFRREEMTIVPQPSAFSLAAARLGWALAGCASLSLHGRPLDSLRLHLAPGRRCLLLSEDGSTPRRVAGLLAASGWGPSRMSVFLHLGGPREAVRHGTAQDWGEQESADLNTIALECTAAPGTRAWSLLAGLPDDAFEHDGQLTKREVRAVTLSRLAPLPGETLWDIGAGSGSIAIEWLRAVPDGAAIAVEQNHERAATILYRRRHRRARPVAGAVGGVASGRPACRQCREPRRRARHPRMAGAPWRRAGADRAQPRGAARRPPCLAAADAGDPAGRDKARLRCEGLPGG